MQRQRSSSNSTSSFNHGSNVNNHGLIHQRNIVEEYDARLEEIISRNSSVVRFDNFGSGGQIGYPVSPSTASAPIRDVLQSRPRVLMMRAERPDVMPSIVPVRQPSVTSVTAESRARLLRRDGSVVGDVHADMLLDVARMSYEELLALEDEMEDVTEDEMEDVSTGLSVEAISNVSTGLSVEAVSRGMRRLTYQSMRLGLPVEERCCICHEDYVDREEQGKLDCGHDFHFNCIRQWLMQQNSCPLCRTTALPA